MTYMHLGIESLNCHTQALCGGQKLLNTVLQSSLKKCLEFSIKQLSFSFSSGVLALKKNKNDSTETITMESPKKVTTIS